MPPKVVLGALYPGRTKYIFPQRVGGEVILKQKHESLQHIVDLYFNVEGSQHIWLFNVNVEMNIFNTLQALCFCLFQC